MRATIINSDVSEQNRLAVDTRGLQNLLSCGRVTAVQIGEDAGARIEIGRRVFWNVSKIKDYLDVISQ